MPEGRAESITAVALPAVRLTATADAEAGASITATLTVPTTELISIDTMGGFGGSSSSRSGGVSRDGRFVLMTSSATDLVAGVSGRQVYLRDRWLGTTEVASLQSDGTPIVARRVSRSVNRAMISAGARGRPT